MQSDPLLNERVQVETNVDIPMRDGIRLRADLFHPAFAAGPRGVILVRTPYGKQLLPESAKEVLRRFVEHGYSVMVQDLRGKHDSEGEFRIGRGNRADGHDTLDWIVAQPWSDGAVGTWGCSYLGENQVYLATTAHPALKACIPMAAGAALGTANGRYARWGFRTMGGHFLLRTLTEWYARYAGSRGRTDEDRVMAVLRLLEEGKTAPEDLMARGGLPDAEWREIVALDHQSPYWVGTDYLNEGEPITAPMLVIDSWFDPAIASGLSLFDYVRSHGATARIREGSRLVVGPTCHCLMHTATEQTLVGDRHVGDARLDWVGLYLGWFDQWLRGRPAAPGPVARLFEIGANRWREEEIWPIRSQSGTLYLTAEGGMVAAAPDAASALSLEVNPMSLVPSLGGTGFGLGKNGAVDQSALLTRRDVAVFRSGPLARGLTLFGTSRVVLYVTSEREDCDVFVTLLEISPEGTAYNVQDGSLRGSCREGPAVIPSKMAPGEKYLFRIEIGATLTRIAPGHQLGVMISTTSYPNYPAPESTNVVNVHIGADSSSRLEYEMIP